MYDKPTIQKALDLYRKIAPTLVFTHAPKDYMMDHEMVSLLARNASFCYPSPNISQLPVLEGSQVPHLYYCDPIEGIDPFGHPASCTTYIDITSVMPTKIEMLACHASQREWLRAHHGIDEYIEAMKSMGLPRGQQIDRQYAEAFIQHRGHSYPRHDLLAEYFGNHAALPSHTAM